MKARDEANDNIALLKKQLADRREAAHKLEIELTTAKTNATNRADLLQAKSQSLATALTDLNRYRATVDKNEKDYQSLLNDQTKLKDEFSEAGKRIEDLKDRLSARNGEAQQLEKELKAAEKNLLERADQLQKKTEAASELTVDLARLRGVLDEKEASYKSLRTERDRIATARDEANDNIEQLEEQLASRKARAEELKAQLASAQEEVSTRTAELMAKTEEAAGLATDLEGVKVALADNRENLEQLRLQHTAVMASRDAAQNQASDLRSKLDRADESHRNARRSGC